jgi:short-subunit dehydrogenase
MARKNHAFANRVVWITGASSGIGEALALRCAQDGACLVLSARREAELQRVAQRCAETGLAKDKIMVAPLDITDLDAIPVATDAVMKRFGQVDLLINNAGMSQRSLCKDTDLSVYRQLLDVDVLGQIALTKAVLPHMLERRAGHIAVTASVAGKVGARQRTGYCAAKHAVMGFFDSLRAEVEDDGVQVSTIVPGFINTELSYNALAADGSRFAKQDDNIAGGMDVTECADVIVAALARGKREIPVGKGKEMAALWIKRAAPGLVFKMVKKL